VEIVLSIVVIAIVLLQTKGAGFTGMFGGDSTSVYRTRRGLEKRMFQFTIGLSTAFFLIALINSFKF
jgi:preprotein translocase subunit SecG